MLVYKIQHRRNLLANLACLFQFYYMNFVKICLFKPVSYTSNNNSIIYNYILLFDNNDTTTNKVKIVISFCMILNNVYLCVLKLI